MLVLGVCLFVKLLEFLFNALVIFLDSKLVKGFHVVDLCDQILPRLNSSLEQLDVVHHFCGFVIVVPESGCGGKSLFFGYLFANVVRVKDAPIRP